MKKVYLDFAATSPMLKEVEEGITPYFSENFGNPSSIHAQGRSAMRMVNRSRSRLAEILQVSPKEIIFTSGGTESDNLAIKGAAIALQDKGKHIITCQTEHPAVLESFSYLEKLGWQITILPVDKNGELSLTELEGAITKETTLISIMHANNEIGTIHPISEISAVAKDRSICFHVDGVQSFGKIPVEIKDADLFSISAHKIGGPKGAGLLYVKKGTKIIAQSNGGGHEYGLRSGTLNVSGIVGSAIAAEIAVKQCNPNHMRELRDYFLSKISHISKLTINGSMKNRLPNNLNISILDAEGEAMLIKLDAFGIYCSTGSACSSSSHSESHVLKAIGLPTRDIQSTLRFTLGATTTKEDLDYTADKLNNTVRELRAMAPGFDSDYS